MGWKVTLVYALLCAAAGFFGSALQSLASTVRQGYWIGIGVACFAWLCLMLIERFEDWIWEQEHK